MPFMASGGGGAGPAPAAGPVTMQIEPDQILALKTRYEAVRDTIQDYFDSQRDSLVVRPLADDDVSRDAAKIFADNATTALEVLTAFIGELDLNIDQLDRAASTYNLTDDTVETSMQQQNRGI
jgi:hypothetical protein